MFEKLYILNLKMACEAFTLHPTKYPFFTHTLLLYLGCLFRASHEAY